MQHSPKPPVLQTAVAYYKSKVKLQPDTELTLKQLVSSEAFFFKKKKAKPAFYLYYVVVMDH